MNNSFIYYEAWTVLEMACFFPWHTSNLPAELGLVFHEQNAGSIHLQIKELLT